MTDLPPSPPAPEAGMAPLPESKGGASKVIIGIVAVVVAVVLAVLAVVVVRNVLSGSDPTQDAKAGDCLANLPEAAAGQETSVKDAKVVACDSADAKFTVVARVDDVNADQAKTDEVCAAHKEATLRFYAIPAGGGSGYVLCLKPA